MQIDTLGGYRIVRQLGTGPRANVYLGYAHDPAEPSPPVAIKVYHPDVRHEAVVVEATALSRAWGDHTVELLDLVTGPTDLPALVLGRLSGSTLPRLLQERAHVRVGEAITLLAPLAAAVGRLHAAGVAHGAIATESILFDAVGSPVLCRFGRAHLFDSRCSPAALSATPAVAADMTAFAGLACRVLSRVEGATTQALVEWLTGDSQLTPNDWLTEFDSRLFRLGEPEAIGFRADTPADRNPHRLLGTPQPVVLVSASPRRAARDRGRSEVESTMHRIVLAVPRRLGRVFSHVPGARRIGDSARSSLSAVRPRVWLAAGAVGAALIAAVLLVPAGESGATPQPASLPSAQPSVPPTDGATSGDDPAAAALELLGLRERCIRDLSVLCLDAVDQQGSSALGYDQQLIRQLQDGAELPELWNIAEVSAEERLGGSALVEISEPAESEPAALLLVKGEAGWRIRDYVGR